MKEFRDSPRNSSFGHIPCSSPHRSTPPPPNYPGPTPGLQTWHDLGELERKTHNFYMHFLFRQTYIQIINIFHCPNLFVYYIERSGVDKICVNTLIRNWENNNTNDRSIIGSKWKILLKFLKRAFEQMLMKRGIKIWCDCLRREYAGYVFYTCSAVYVVDIEVICNNRNILINKVTFKYLLSGVSRRITKQQTHTKYFVSDSTAVEYRLTKCSPYSKLTKFETD